MTIGTMTNSVKGGGPLVLGLTAIGGYSQGLLDLYGLVGAVWLTTLAMVFAFVRNLKGVS